ncbi:dihydrofolate reductase [Deinococcus psychrotolerans]|uniref:Dihydrofolate reductase n=1 Tax=Deinococcus psychrotolerans TaxID=2489213 RepID=A0A3G8YFE3_9DEIO|nr:dihydrofolate reductase family protein [Deinococcus psychrotolerans]AZI44049.1 dihydrofolate reductase [Deinococcus psychrotolerans]
MRRIVAVEYLSLDGIMSNPMWTAPYFSEELGTLQDTWITGSDSLLLGRVTYEGMSTAWIANTDGSTFTERINALPKHVATRTLTDLAWNATPLSHDIVEEVRALKQGEGANVLIYGSGELVRSLLEHHLIDEFHLIVCPVVVGEGRRLFSEDSRAALHLASTHATTTGVIVLSYRTEQPSNPDK